MHIKHVRFNKKRGNEDVNTTTSSPNSNQSALQNEGERRSEKKATETMTNI